MTAGTVEDVTGLTCREQRGCGAGREEAGGGHAAAGGEQDLSGVVALAAGVDDGAGVEVGGAATSNGDGAAVADGGAEGSAGDARAGEPRRWTVERHAAASRDGDVAAVAGAMPVLGVHGAAGVHDDIAADGEAHGAGRVAPGPDVIAVDRAVDDQVTIHGEDAIDDVVRVVGRSVEGAEVHGAVDGHVARECGQRKKRDHQNGEQLASESTHDTSPVVHRHSPRAEAPRLSAMTDLRK